MTQDSFLQPALKALAYLQMMLNKLGGPMKEGDLFEQILEIQDTILNKFGLPINPDHEQILLFNSIPSDAEINRRIKQLHTAATNHLLSSVSSELETLREARRTRQDALYVLPELKIPNHTYTIFVYEEILLKEKDSIENVLQELRTSNRPEILNALGEIQFGKADKRQQLIDFLQTEKLKYVDQFLMHIADF